MEQKPLQILVTGRGGEALKNGAAGGPWKNPLGGWSDGNQTEKTLQRKTRERVEAEKALLQVQDDLEVRVREKTAQLVRACEPLKKKEDRLQHQLKRMRLLNQMTRAMIQRQDKHSLFTVALKYLEDHLSVDFGCVLLLDQDEEIFTVAATGTTDLKLAKKWGMYPGTLLPIDPNGLRRCVEGKSVYEPDISLLYTPALEGLAAEGFRSMVLTPLAVEDEVLGVLLTMRRKPGSFTSGSFEFLQQLAEHVALGAQNAKLYEDLHDACNDLRKTQMTVMRQERLRALGQDGLRYGPRHQQRGVAHSGLHRPAADS